MGFFAWLADRLVLVPSTKPIPSELNSEKVTTEFGVLESWWCDSNPESNQVDVLAIKIPGAGGRAERGSPHPFEQWGTQGINVRTWTLNHHGYGNSSGKASLRKFGQTCDAIWAHVRNFGTQPVVVVGNSLGCTSALYLAARYPVAGLFLRNPVPLQQMIAQRPRYNRWSFGIAKQVAASIPDELDSVLNASQADCPAVFVQSAEDRVVPVAYQDLIRESYGGHQEIFTIRGADHHHKIPVDQEQEYLNCVKWLEQKVVGR